ncbi:MAG: RsiV family protein [Planctomycetes bacterium]|nr:RsiV family protein [Planctomycetota bacterium]
MARRSLPLRVWGCVLLLPLLPVLAADLAGERSYSLHYQWRFDGSVPHFGVEAVDTAIREWVEETLQRGLGNGAALASGGPEVTDGTWELALRHATTRPSATIVSVLFTCQRSFSRAAHPSTDLTALHFDLASGTRLGFSDLFADGERALAIMAEQAPRLVEAFYDAGRPGLTGTGDLIPFFHDGFAPIPDNYACLGLEEGGVRVYFPPYQILPYAYGTAEAFIPLSLLREAGPSRAVWPNQDGGE